MSIEAEHVIHAEEGIDVAEIRNIWEKFHKQCPDGKATPEMMMKVLRDASVDIDTISEDPNFIARMFDTDSDGLVDFNELIHGLDTLEYGEDIAILRQMFRGFDMDGNKVLDVNEMKQVSKALGSDSDGEEFTDEEADAVLDEFDTNKDGVVTEEEFISVMKHAIDKGD